MSHDHAPLESKATFNHLYLLAQQGLIDAQALERSLHLIGHVPSVRAWGRFLNAILLILGAVLSISGVFFFFAFNWASLSDFFKLGLIEGAILLAVGLTTYLGLNKLPGKITLTLAAMLVGALLAVYGQVYQTGADYYGLFLSWAGLISVWAIINAFSPLWLVVLGLLNLSLGLYWTQVIGDLAPTFYVYIAFFWLNGMALAAWELGRHQGWAWLQGRWWPNLVACLIFIVLVIPTLEFITRSVRFQDDFLWLLPLLYILFTAFSLIFYVHYQPDLFRLTLAAFSLIVVITTAVGQYFEFRNALEYLILSLLVLGQAALAVRGLRWVAQTWERDS